jgi:hypothetical protein
MSAKNLQRAGALRFAYQSVFDLAGIFGCSLNGKDAKLDVAPASGLARVQAKDGSDTAVFNWSVCTRVMKECKGNFVTRDLREVPQRRWTINPLLA